ncbi:Uncharacterised protein [Anaerococcus prevotii]|uniref:Phage protein Gp138 N-terminal domain-containing protein n=1 Tax=Anaerococcus prevotii (strain ATCC 9321 / DSM 20548 / JCM 6508 / NCTC 11806 / PC1) TaxID=525919 RepID=C7RHC0_ANAPD|nr:Gp138 family membrane-puncturing spike protein [Anaerococcus prevotii]ACV28881.1 hypothetical protein Apre_0853 [Anaerococcus prevotii DSM 20548]SUU94554.1 Uncharacterised protein [Anaerococcus prevotii]
MKDVLRSKKDTNAAFNKFMDNFTDTLSANTMVAKLAKVKSFDPEKMYIEAMPLPSEENSLVINVPLVTLRCKDFVAYYPLKEGDYVVLLFMDGDTDQILLGQDKADTERMHDVSDCVAIGGFSLFNDTLGVVDETGFVLQNMTNKDSYINLKANGDIEIKGSAINILSPNIKLEGHATYNGREIAKKGDPTTEGGVIV